MKALKTLLAAAVLTAGLAGAARAADAPSSLSKADVEQIVHDYIQSHPADILDSVQSYQDRATRSQQAQAVKVNHETIYNDALTPTAGNEDGDVTVVEFFDYNCGYCKKVTPQIVQLMKDDKKLRILFKDFPILGPSSEAAARWALAAHKQKKYFAFFKAMMENHAPISDALLEKTAKEVGMDIDKAKADISSSDVMLQLERNRSLAANMSIHGTPAFIIGDEPASGAISIDEMREMIANARAGKSGKK